MRHKTLAVIGHVDHGKTTLVNTLTGTWTDTLAEERTRGLSIVPGFAYFDYDDTRVNLIDAPGHEDFVASAIAGMSGASGVLLVIAATDGIKPQTREHTRIASLLGISQAIVVITKADLLETSERNSALRRIETFLSDTPFADAPMIFCDARKGDSSEEIKHALANLTAIAAPPRPTFPLLAIDRVFTVQGSGAVVTGTLLGGDLKIDDELQVMPTETTTSARGLQVNGEPVKAAPANARVAVNLRGVTGEAIKRGSLLSPPNSMTSSELADARLSLLANISRPLKHMEALQVFAGTGNGPATARLLTGRAVSTNAPAFVQLQFRMPRSFYAGQKFILRRFSPPETIGGGIIIDPAARPIGRNKAGQVRVLDAALSGNTQQLAKALSARDGGAFSCEELERLIPGASTHIQTEQYSASANNMFVLKTDLDALANHIEAALFDLHTARPLRLTFDRAILSARLGRYHPAVFTGALKQLEDRNRLRSLGTEIGLLAHDPHAAMTAEQHAIYAALEEGLLAAGLEAKRVPTPDAEPTENDDMLALLIAAGKAVKLYNHGLKQELVFHRDALIAAERALRAAFTGAAPFSTGQARIQLGTSRRIIVPLLEHFDEAGITKRKGDARRFIHTD